MLKRTEHRWAKTEAVSSRGMVAAMHPLAAEAGAEILAKGGNAIDAAVAIGFAIGVVEPYNSGIGAIAVLVHYDAKTGKTTAIDGTGPLPRKISTDVFTLVDSEERSGVYQWRAVVGDANNRGHLSVAVPGTPACLCEAHTRFGRLPLAEVMAPAIRLAEEGFLIDWVVAAITATNLAALWKNPAAKRIYCKEDGSPFQSGSFMIPPDRVVQSDLGATLRRVAAHGHDGFYRGETARLIAEDMAANGGLLDEEDLAAYKPRVYKPALISDYHGYQIVHSPVTNGGPTVVEMLNILEQDRLGTYGLNSVRALHLIIESQRRAFSDRFLHLGDPDFAPVPLEGVVSKSFAAERRSGIDPDRATPNVTAGDAWAHQERVAEPALSGAGVGGSDGCTTHFNVIDGDGNMVSCTSTHGQFYGSAVVAEGTGVLLNNGVMWFDPEPGSIVSVGPGKRIMTAGTPTLVLKQGKPFLAIGAPGGRRVISAIFQGLVNILDHGLTPAEAIAAPRVHCEGVNVEVDSRLPATTLDGLRELGHNLIVREETPVNSSFARPTGILIDPDTGLLRGGATPFGPATAIGL
jgi:gamma-glutamyltranspeptidase/glutathione hydrolase